MGPVLGRFRAGVLAVLALGFLAGCAASHPGEKKDDPAGVSVHLPALEPMDIETRTQPPAVQPALVFPPPYPDDVEEGKARSLNMLEIHHDGGKASRPSGGAPPEADGKP